MAATNNVLGLLHKQVAEVMAAMLVPREIPVMEKDEDGDEVQVGVRMEYPSPAVIAVAVKFLKDNSISADIENDAALSELKEALAKRRQPSKRDMDDALNAVGRGLLN